MERSGDIIVAGAGPSGLAAAVACTVEGYTPLLIESGLDLPERDTENHMDICSGVGGCGLYSDGKFSFFPSATSLWRLADRECLERSYGWLSAILHRAQMNVPPFPALDSGDGNDVTQESEEDIFVKTYPSLYMPHEQRLRLIEFLVGSLGDSVITNAELARVTFNHEDRNSRCDVLVTGMQQEQSILKARAVVFAGGRYGPVKFPKIFPNAATVFRRLEVGVRIQQQASAFFLKDDPRLDPKIICRSQERRYSWRTFCCCRDGEIMVTKSNGIMSVCGRGNCSTEGVSNVGFNVRVSDKSLATVIWPDLLAALQVATAESPQLEPMDVFLSSVDRSSAGGQSTQAALLGGHVSGLLAEGLKKLKRAYPALETVPSLVIAPALEGVAFYPNIDMTLRCMPYPLWIAGDASGLFRGLTAGLVSGFFAGMQATRYLKSTSMR